MSWWRSTSSAVGRGGRQVVTVDSSEASMRADQWLRSRFLASYPLIQKALRTGQVRRVGVDSEGDSEGRRKILASDRVVAGQQVEVRIPLVPIVSAQSSGVGSSGLPSLELPQQEVDKVRRMVLYKNSDLIVINKPAGLAVQGGPKIAYHVDGMLDGLRYSESDERPRLVHRIDKNVSGVLVLARNKDSARFLGEWFRYRRPNEMKFMNNDSQTLFQRKPRGVYRRAKGDELRVYVKKVYMALVSGKPSPAQGRIRTLLDKVGGPGEEHMVVTEDRSPTSVVAITEYSLLNNASKECSLLSMSPLTGRKHQLRVHCASVLKTPVLGDTKYGRAVAESLQPMLGNSAHLLLHARRILLPYVNEFGEYLTVEAPLPPYMRKACASFAFDSNF